MKIRIRDNTVRLRLTKTEVTVLAETGEVSCITDFGNGMLLTYRICKSDNSPGLSASFENNVITVMVPNEKVMHWANSEEISLMAEQKNKSGMPLRLLIEKDFACLVVRQGEDDSDAFPNPT